jgi:hypothetical protein
MGTMESPEEIPENPARQRKTECPKLPLPRAGQKEDRAGFRGGEGNP